MRAGEIAWRDLCVCPCSRLPLLVFIFLFFVFLSLCAPRRLWSFLFPRPVPSLRCVDPVSCGRAAPFRGVLRVPHLRSASSATGLVRSVWFPRHVCPLSRPTWLVFCAMALKALALCGYTIWIALVPLPVFLCAVLSTLDLDILRFQHLHRPCCTWAAITYLMQRSSSCAWTACTSLEVRVGAFMEERRRLFLALPTTAAWPPFTLRYRLSLWGSCASATAVPEQLLITTSLRPHSGGKLSLDIFGAQMSASRICTVDGHLATWGYD